jgi:hypothetical protein
MTGDIAVIDMFSKEFSFEHGSFSSFHLFFEFPCHRFGWVPRSLRNVIPDLIRFYFITSIIF